MYNKQINRSYFQILITTATLFIISILFLSNLVSKHQALPFNSLFEASIFSVLFALVTILLIKIFLKLPISSYPMLFIIATFLYTLSSFVLFPLDGWDAFRDYKVVDPKGIEIGLPIVLLGFASFMVGSLISYLKHIYTTKESVQQEVEETRIISPLRLIAIIIYWISVILILYSTLTGGGLALSYSGGYEDFSDARKLGNLPYIVTVTYAWFLPWSTLIILGTTTTKKQVVSTILLCLLSVTILLLTGNRTSPTIILVLSIAVFQIRKIPIKWWQIVLVFIAVVVIVSSWDAIRKLPISSWNIPVLVTEVSNETLGADTGETDYYQYKTPFGWILSNVANSYQTLMGAVRLVPDIEPYRYGSDYLRAVFITFPFLSSSGLLNLADQPTTWITDRLYGGWAGLGFLQVGEAYINFSWLGVVALYTSLGLLLTQLWWKLDAHHLKGQFLSYSLIFMMGLLNWIRNDSSNMGRILVWGFIIVYVLPWLHMKITRRRNIPELKENMLRS